MLWQVVTFLSALCLPSQHNVGPSRHGVNYKCQNETSGNPWIRHQIWSDGLLITLENKQIAMVCFGLHTQSLRRGFERTHTFAVSVPWKRWVFTDPWYRDFVGYSEGLCRLKQNKKPREHCFQLERLCVGQFAPFVPHTLVDLFPQHFYWSRCFKHTVMPRLLTFLQQQ